MDGAQFSSPAVICGAEARRSWRQAATIARIRNRRTGSGTRHGHPRRAMRSCRAVSRRGPSEVPSWQGEGRDTMDRRSGQALAMGDEVGFNGKAPEQSSIGLFSDPSASCRPDSRFDPVVFSSSLRRAGWVCPRGRGTPVPDVPHARDRQVGNVSVDVGNFCDFPSQTPPVPRDTDSEINYLPLVVVMGSTPSGWSAMYSSAALAANS